MAAPVPPVLQQRIDIYKAYLDDLGRLGSRHETARTFYITVVSALFTFLGLGNANGIFGTVSGGVQKGIGVIGAALSVAWALHMLSFRALFKAKISVLRAGESGFEFQPFTHERPTNYVPITWVDMAVAAIFFVLFIGVYVL